MAIHGEEVFGDVVVRIFARSQRARVFCDAAPEDIGSVPGPCLRVWYLGASMRAQLMLLN
jgi:hypothetical protein